MSPKTTELQSKNDWKGSSPRPGGGSRPLERKIEANNRPDSEPKLPPSDVTVTATLEAWAQAGKQHWLPITGRSMRPLLREGDEVLVAHGGAGVRPGDVIAFRRNDGLLVHRVMRVSDKAGERTLFTKGDSRARFDAPVPASEIVGRVVSIRRGDRQTRLDTLTWRAVGWIITAVTLALATPYAWARSLKHKFAR